MDARQRVLSAVETCDGTTRAELAEELDLPLGTVTTAVAGLLRAGALAERPAGNSPGSRAGRPAMLLVPTGPPRTVGAVVWAHGRLQIAVATYGGTILARDDIPVADDPSDPEILEPAWRFLDRAGQGPLDRVVLGVPAPFQRGVGLPPGRLPVPGPGTGQRDTPRSGFEIGRASCRERV